MIQLTRSKSWIVVTNALEGSHSEERFTECRPIMMPQFVEPAILEKCLKRLLATVHHLQVGAVSLV